MFDVAPTELLLVAIVALLVIGPKDLPKAMRFVGYWVGRARGVARQFRSGFDTMVREAELQEMEKRWSEENERIMREHPSPTQMLPVSPPDDVPAIENQPAGAEQAPVLAEAPAIVDQPVAPEPAPEAGEAPPAKKRVRKAYAKPGAS